MKVLFQIRPDFIVNPAQDSLCVLFTKKYLQALGVNVYISTDSFHDYSGYDLVHIFNLASVTYTYTFTYRAHKQGIPVVLTPIYLNSVSFNKNPPPEGKWARRRRIIKSIILSKTSIVLVNSQLELDCLVRDFHIKKPFQWVPWGVDRRFPLGDGEHFFKKYGLRDFVLCVGGISPRKNQLMLIKALKDIDVNLILIGTISNTAYGKACFKEGGDRVMFIQRQSLSDLRNSYAAATLYALPSLFEIPGQSNLEAAAAGCTVVTTKYGCTREYLGKLAHYCSPHDISDIRGALLRGFEHRTDGSLQKHVLANYTWEQVAKRTLNAYKRILR